MTSSVRQAELFQGEDWRVVYRAFLNINFNASDPPSINAALRQYIVQTYPEDYNDWVESAEFVALIDLLSWLAGTLAFRTDINARENFLETAEARESVLRLARFLSYTPRRNQAARGLAKLVAVQTDDDVIDSFGTNLNTARIQWNDPDNADWFEQFSLVLNNAFIATNPFGVPLKNGLVGDIKTQLYRLNNTANAAYPFTATVAGNALDFEVVNMDFDVGGGFTERSPDLASAMHLCYRNDGNGNGSSNTGFFLFFKQGTLGQQLFQIDIPIENRVIDIDVAGINDGDLTCQTVTDTGQVLSEWTRVPVLVTDNITFNSLPIAVRDIYQVVTRDNDQISLRFSDGRFGSVPTGNLRVWYRVSSGDQTIIRPTDMDRITINIPYVNRRGVTKTLVVTFSLQDSIANGVARETDEQVRRRAPQVFATQNRMVSGEDYNTFPLSTNLAVKLKAVNRTYSGHSRYIDLNDPTGTFQDTNIFGDDGIFYVEPSDAYDEIPPQTNRSAAQILDGTIQPRLASEAVANQVLDTLVARLGDSDEFTFNATWWHQSSTARFSSTGVLSKNPAQVVAAMTTTLRPGSYVRPGGLIKFRDAGWVGVGKNSLTDMIGPTGRGSIELAEVVATADQALAALPPISTTLTEDERQPIIDSLTNKLGFDLYYDYDGQTWTTATLTAPPPSATSIKVMTAQYIAGSWQFRTSGTRYVFESETECRFYFDNDFHAVDSATGLEKRDLIRLLPVNAAPGGSGGLGKPFDLDLRRSYFYPDGYREPRRVQVTFADHDMDGVPDDPATFYEVVGDDSYVYWLKQTDSDDEYFVPLDDLPSGYSRTDAGYVNDPNGTIDLGYRWRRGRNKLLFQWKHYAPSDHRIDPSPTNIIDCFVLDTSYDTVTRQWIRNGSDPAQMPVPPSELELSILFADMDDAKMYSDSLIWRPVKYKFLFGAGAADEVRAQFKVVKLPNTTLADGEIKSQVIRAINTFFDVQNWDFGETFYYTEMAAYVHQQLANIIGSIVLVPLAPNQAFGDLFEIHCSSDEIFVSTAQVSDVVIVNANTAKNLRINY